MANRIRNQEFRVKLQHGHKLETLWMYGKFLGRDTYLSFGDWERESMAILDGQSLYRLAKAIVRRFEPDEKTVRDLAYTLWERRVAAGEPGTQDQDWFNALDKLS